ncbi:universal stress protein [Nocardia sp. alder85J]|uniref:universal stress protein n=1 Tax=Nocardia sp. alder85J TaxID=2862949 RepID=UPI001CD3D7C9|nr:universal stress protein [Nocardia sp. alder85J]MCX4092479.1 universal stress protein [Nocardia sp. alder85J]
MTDSTSAPDAADQSVLVAVDGSQPSTHAVAWAAAEAVLHHRNLHIVTSYGYHPLSGLDAVLATREGELLRSAAEHTLARAERAARRTRPEVRVSTQLTFELIVPMLIDRSTRAAMIVVGSRRYGPVRRTLFGSVSTEVSRRAHCPVAIVSEGVPTDPAAANRPVLAGVDDLDTGAATLDIAFDEAARRKVGVVVLKSGQDSNPPEFPGATVRRHRPGGDDDPTAEWRARYPHVPVEALVVVEDSVSALLDRARQAQLLVIGSHGLTGFAGLHDAAATAELSRQVDCPVIVAHGR